MPTRVVLLSKAFVHASSFQVLLYAKHFAKMLKYLIFTRSVSRKYTNKLNNTINRASGMLPAPNTLLLCQAFVKLNDVKLPNKIAQIS